jgi:hypothetical protein
MVGACFVLVVHAPKILTIRTVQVVGILHVHAFIGIRATAHKKVITKGFQFFGNMFAEDVLNPHTLTETALYHRMVPGAD